MTYVATSGASTEAVPATDMSPLKALHVEKEKYN